MSKRGGGDTKRARDHYRWADRYNKEGLFEKAAAHIKRAVHYGRTSFGNGTFDGAWACQIEQQLCVWTVSDDGIPTLFPARPYQADLIDALLASEKKICTDRPHQIQVFPADQLIKYHTTKEASLSALRFDIGANTRQTRFHSSMYIAPNGFTRQHTYEDAVRIGNECIALGFPSCLYTENEHQDSSIRLVEDWRPGRLKIFVFDQPTVDDQNVPTSMSQSSPKPQSRWHDAKPYQKYAYFKFMRDTKYGSTHGEVAFRNSVSTKQANLIPPEFFDTSKRNQKAIDFTIFRSGPDGCVYLRRSDKSILRMSDCSVLQSIADSAYRAFAARMTDDLESTVYNNPFTKRCPICHEEKDAKEIQKLSPCGTMGCAACSTAILKGTQCPCDKTAAHTTEPRVSGSTSAGASSSSSSSQPAKKQKTVDAHEEEKNASPLWMGTPYGAAKETWFSKLFGESALDDRAWLHANASIVEGGYTQTYGTTSVSSSTLRLPDRSFVVGSFAIPMLRDLAAQVSSLPEKQGTLISKKLEIGPKRHIACVSTLHGRKENRLATFQVASQFNCLEMTSKDATPDFGIWHYEDDRTQGPACSIACGAATLYRNYFAPVTTGGYTQIGQTEACQINTLTDALAVIEDDPGDLVTFQNGYIDATVDQLKLIRNHLANEVTRKKMKARVRVGVQSDVQVTSSIRGTKAHTSVGVPHLVTQVFCSACPVSHSGVRPGGTGLNWRTATDPDKNEAKAHWEALARLILEATYEATMYAALMNAHSHNYEEGSNRVFLTRVGGGDFGNAESWIDDAIEKVLAKFQHYDLIVFKVVYTQD